MEIVKHYLTKNDCYKAGEHIKVKGLMIHSTGANNPKLSRYIDDPALGNYSSNHWNQPEPGGRQVCVHGFIGEDKNGDVKTYQTLPWDMRGWHAGGSANNNHIGVEICEDDLKDPKYFAAVYKEAVELFAYLCKRFGLTEKDVITHSEGHKEGIASNHSDVMHWFPKHGKSMDTFRADIRKQLLGKAVASKPSTNTSGKHVVAKGDSLWGIARENNLTVAELKAINGIKTDLIKVGQTLVVRKPSGTVKPVAPATPAKSIDQLAKEVIDGKHGSGDARRRALGSRYDAVQNRVNDLLNPQESVHELALKVIRGDLGSGEARKKALGSRYDAVQAEVNRILK
jgi:N-acetylmuramoyl-L-alanine amidase